MDHLPDNEHQRHSAQRRQDDALLDSIRRGDPQAEHHLWVTYVNPVSPKAIRRPELRTLPDPFDHNNQVVGYAHDAVLILITQARRQGGGVLKHNHSTISGWINQTVTNFIRSETRRNCRFERDAQLDADEADPTSRMAQLADDDAAGFADLPEKDRSALVVEVLAGEPDETKCLVQAKFIDGFTWPETGALLRARYPDRKTAFTDVYTQKTYWDRNVKDTFQQKIIAHFNRYGYDIRRKR